MRPDQITTVVTGTDKRVISNDAPLTYRRLVAVTGIRVRQKIRRNDRAVTPVSLCYHIAASLHILYRRTRVYAKWTPRRRFFIITFSVMNDIELKNEGIAKYPRSLEAVCFLRMEKCVCRSALHEAAIKFPLSISSVFSLAMIFFSCRGMQVIIFLSRSTIFWWCADKILDFKFRVHRSNKCTIICFAKFWMYHEWSNEISRKSEIVSVGLNFD